MAQHRERLHDTRTGGTLRERRTLLRYAGLLVLALGTCFLVVQALQTV